MKKILLMIAFGAMVLGVNAQVKVFNDGKLFLGRVGMLDGWVASYLQWHGHHLIMGSPVGTNLHNSLTLMPGGATQGTLYSQFRMYSATAPNQHTLKVQIISEGGTYFINPGNFGIGTSNPSYKLHVYGGHLGVSGAIFSNGSWISSDSVLKSNIQPINDALSTVMSLDGKKYSLKNMISDGNRNNINYGFIAQEVEKLIPELVDRQKDSLGLLVINYDGFIPIIVEAMKEQQNTIEDLQQEVETLRTALVACCSNKTQKSMQEFDLGEVINDNIEELKVYQNTPNPFTETTIISCYIPETIKKAELCIYDMSGSRLKCLTVTDRGATTIQIQAGQLAAGVYTYLLIGDGKNSDAKQMILTK